jgi:hypothetical protein
MTDGSLSFILKEHRPGLHSTRRTEERKEETRETTDDKKRSRMQEISSLPQHQGLERQLRLMSTVPSRETQEKLLKTLAESGRLLVPGNVENQGVDSTADGDDRPSKRLKA